LIQGARQKEQKHVQTWLGIAPAYRTRVALLGLLLLTLFFWRDFGLLTTGRTANSASDFVGRYAGARLAWTGHLYDSQRVAHELSSLVGVDVPALHFNQLPFYAALISPLGALPFPAAFAVWQALSLLAIVLSVLLWREAPRGWMAVVCCWSYPLMSALGLAQDTTFLLLLAVLCLHWHQKRPVMTGLLSALFAIKPHLFLLWPVLLVFQHRWRITAGFLAGTAAITAASFAVGGPHWPAQLYRVITSPLVSPRSDAMPNLHGAFHLFGLPLWLEAMACVLVVVAVCLSVPQMSFERGFAAALSGGILISYHAYASDCVLLIPALIILIPESRQAWRRLVCLFLITPPIYQLAWAGGRFALPIQTAVAGLFGMCLFRETAKRAPMAAYDTQMNEK
jgi:alpha-1,2-mannosyltransferase